MRWQSWALGFSLLYILVKGFGSSEYASMVTPARFYIQSYFVETRLVVYEGEYWRVVLHEKQNPHFLRSIVRLKRVCESPVCLTSAERRERDEIELVLHTLVLRYGATYTNFMRLMNNAYRSPIPMPVMHYHFIPRYKTPFSFGEIYFHDKAYGRHYSENEEKPVPPALMLLIKNIVGKEFKDRMPKPSAEVAFFLKKRKNHGMVFCRFQIKIFRNLRGRISVAHLVERFDMPPAYQTCTAEGGK